MENQRVLVSFPFKSIAPVLWCRSKKEWKANMACWAGHKNSRIKRVAFGECVLHHDHQLLKTGIGKDRRPDKKAVGPSEGAPCFY